MKEKWENISFKLLCIITLLNYTICVFKFPFSAFQAEYFKGSLLATLLLLVFSERNRFLKYLGYANMYVPVILLFKWIGYVGGTFGEYGVYYSSIVWSTVSAVFLIIILAYVIVRQKVRRKHDNDGRG